jgi:carotenoid 1,2-hydratase
LKISNLPFTGRTQAEPRPAFDPEVEADGYRWWYLDAVSADRQHAITIIAFIGSVFSPYYKWARGRGPTPAQNHCAVNIAIYGRSGKRWAMTERGAGALECSRDSIRVGPSALHWTGDHLAFEVDEITVPIPSRIRGQIRLYPESRNDLQFMLDERGLHHWQPIFPRARVEINLCKPDLKWRGDAYFDSNFGSAPLEDDFIGWNWCRASTPANGTTLIYDRNIIQQGRRCLGVHFDKHGSASAFEPGAEISLPTTSIWRIQRATRASPKQRFAGRLQTLEDTPFYARSLLTIEQQGQAQTAVHESLSMTRFKHNWVRLLLPFKMPRRGGTQPPLHSREA